MIPSRKDSCEAVDGKGTKLNFQNGKNRKNDGNCENDKNGGENDDNCENGENGGENGKTVNNCSDVSQEEEWRKGESEPLEASFLKDEVKKMVKISSRLWIRILHACLTRNMNYF